MTARLYIGIELCTNIAINYPISLFDYTTDRSNPLTGEHVIYNPATLGLKLERDEQLKLYDENKTEIAGYDIKNMKQYASAVTNVVLENIYRKPPDLSNEKGRTIYISYGDISARVRNIPVEQRKMLNVNGVIAAAKFFNEPTARL